MQAAKGIKKVKLYDVEQWYWNSVTKTSTRVATIASGKPFSLARFLKRLEELKDKPKGTFYTIPKHETPEDIDAARNAYYDSVMQEFNVLKHQNELSNVQELDYH